MNFFPTDLKKKTRPLKKTCLLEIFGLFSKSLLLKKNPLPTQNVSFFNLFKTNNKKINYFDKSFNILFKIKSFKGLSFVQSSRHIGHLTTPLPSKHPSQKTCPHFPLNGTLTNTRQIVHTRESIVSLDTLAPIAI